MSLELVKINYGAGELNLPGFINIDIEVSKEVKPDLIADLRKCPLPFKDDSVECIYMIHAIEHIEIKYWPRFFVEFYRVLLQDGHLVFAYPEFEICAQKFIENHKGMRDFWRAALYGRQLYPGDYHVVPMISSDLAESLKSYGFRNIKYGPDPQHDGYSFLDCQKGKLLMTIEDVYRKEIFKIN